MMTDANLVPISSAARNSSYVLASRIVLCSFVAAVLLAISAFIVVAVYLFQYLHHAFGLFDGNDMNSLTQLMATDRNADSGAQAFGLAKLTDILLARQGVWKFILQSCGIVSGVAFGFLGFGLFLLGAKGEMDASFNHGEQGVKLQRMAPGSFVILIGAILIGICSIHSVELKYDPISSETQTTVKNGSNGADPNRSGPSTNPVDNPTALPDGPVAGPTAPSGTHGQSGLKNKTPARKLR